MRLTHARGSLDLSSPRIMGVVNASPESFSDSRSEAAASVDERAEQALAMAAQGAAIVDIGGQSARTDQPELPVSVEIERVVPLVAAIRQVSDVCISVDTYRAPVAQAALEAGADIINDVSGGLDPDLLEEVAARRAGLVVMHTRLAPKRRLAPDAHLYADAPAVVADVMAFLEERLERLAAMGVAPEQVVVDPGPDFAKTPAQTVAALSGLSTLAALGHPVLLALSRKDFVGAATGRKPRERGPGTLAAIGWCLPRVPHAIVRVHDVPATADFLAVWDVLDGRRSLDWDSPLRDALRYDR